MMYCCLFIQMLYCNGSRILQKWVVIRRFGHALPGSFWILGLCMKWHFWLHFCSSFSSMFENLAVEKVTEYRRNRHWSICIENLALLIQRSKGKMTWYSQNSSSCFYMYMHLPLQLLLTFFFCQVLRDQWTIGRHKRSAIYFSVCFHTIIWIRTSHLSKWHLFFFVLPFEECR